MEKPNPPLNLQRNHEQGKPESISPARGNDREAHRMSATTVEGERRKKNAKKRIHSDQKAKKNVPHHGGE